MKIAARRRELVATVLLFILAAAARVGHHWAYDEIDPDKARQMTAAENFLRGRGLSECFADPADLSLIRCRPETDWPPGLPLALAALSPWIHDPVRSDLAIGAVALLLILLVSRELIAAWQGGATPDRAYRAFLAFSIIAFAPYAYLNTTDLMALALFALVAVLTVRAARAPPASLDCAAAGALLATATEFRYQYLPLAACAPLTLLALAFVRRDRRLVISVAAYGVAAGALLLAFRFLLPGNTTTRPIERGWWPAHLLSLDPFAFKAFFFVDPIVTRLQRHGYQLAVGADLAAQAVSLAIVAALLHRAWTRRPRPKQARLGSDATVGLFATVTLAVTVGLLVWLSLRVPAEHLPYNPSWTYVWETRYYAPVLLLVVLGAFALAFAPGPRERLARAALALVILAAAYGIGFDLWSYRETVMRGNWTRTYFGRGAYRVEVADTVRAVAGREGMPVVVGFAGMAEAYAAGAVPNFDFREVHASRPVLLLVLAPDASIGRTAAFLQDHHARRLLRLPTEALYQVEIDPSPGT